MSFKLLSRCGGGLFAKYSLPSCYNNCRQKIQISCLQLPGSSTTITRSFATKKVRWMFYIVKREREREKRLVLSSSFFFLVEDDDNLIEKNVLILLFSSFLFQLVFLGLLFFLFYYYFIFSAQKLAEAHKGLSRAIKKLFPCRNSSPAEIVAVRLPG